MFELALAMKAMSIVVAIGCIACIIVVFIAIKAVTFSKITFSAIVAFLLNTKSPFFEDEKTVSFLLYLVIVLVCCFGLCLSHRFNSAYMFFCTATVSFLVSLLMVYGLGNIFASLIGTELEPTVLSETIIKIICCISSVVLWRLTISQYDNWDIFGNKILINIERIISSVIYGITFWFLVSTSTNNVLAVSPVIQGVVAFGTMALTFAADYLLTKER